MQQGFSVACQTARTEKREDEEERLTVGERMRETQRIEMLLLIII